MKVVLSEHNLEETEGFEQVFNVSKIYVNNYTYKTYDNDIMLIKVSRNVSVLLVCSRQMVNISWLCGSNFTFCHS